VEVANLRRRKIRRVSHIKSTMFIIAIIVLSFLGVGYGYWNEGLSMDFAIETGNLIIEAESVSSGSLNARISDGNTINISGTVVSGDSETIELTIRNNGTVPGVLNNTGSVLYPGETETLTIKINPEYTNKASINTVSIQSLESFDVDQALSELYPAQTYSFAESFHFENGL